MFLSLLAVLISGATFFLCLALLGGPERQYATQEDLDEMLKRQRLLGDNQAKLFRYLEAVDDRTDGTGHRVLGVWVPGDDTEDAV